MRWTVFITTIVLVRGAGVVSAGTDLSFTYQGQVKQDGVPVNDLLDIRFRVFKQSGGMVDLDTYTDCDVDVVNGLFTSRLRFISLQAEEFTDGRWLEVSIRSSDDSEYCEDGNDEDFDPDWEVLSPRQEITPAVFAAYAKETAWSGITGVPAGFADGVDNSGELTLPFSASFNGADTSAMTVTQTGVGSAARFVGDNNGNYYELLFASNAGFGPSFMCIKPPTSAGGYCGQFQNLSTSNVFPVMSVKNEADTVTLSVEGSQTGNGYGISAITYGDRYAGKFDGPDNDGVTSTLVVESGSQKMLIDGNEIDGNDGVHINNNLSTDVSMAVGGGKVGIGRIDPGRLLHVGSIHTPNSEGIIRLQSRSGTNGMSRTWDIGVPETDSNTSGQGYSFVINDINTSPPELMIKYGTGQVGIGTSNIPSDVKLEVDGKASVDVLRIKGGSDLSESFDIGGGDVAPGTVVVIDPANPGRLRVSDAPYDRKVAGIVSGAGGISTGMVMGQEGTIASGQYPVALTGRVYALVDGGAAGIEPGDLLTTSSISGHAMRVEDHSRSAGAVIGKAMSGLSAGERGLVLVLVNLQ